jgi:hypothetical protein
LDLDKFPVSATYLPEEHKELWAVLKEFPHTKIVRDPGASKKALQNSAKKPKTEEQLLKQDSKKLSKSLRPSLSKTSISTSAEKNRGPASTLKKYKTAIEKSNRVEWNRTRYKVQPKSQNPVSFSLKIH